MVTPEPSMPPMVLIVYEPSAVGIPEIVNVLAASSFTAEMPVGKPVKLTSEAPPPQVNTVVSIALLKNTS